MSDQAIHRCGAETTDGTPCQVTVRSEEARCHFHDGSEWHIEDGQPRKYSTKAMMKAVVEANGVLVDAADLLGCNRRIILRRRKNEPELDAIINELQQRKLDRIEQSVYERALHDQKTAEYILNAQAKDRGYGKEVKVDNVSSDGSHGQGNTIDLSVLDDDQLEQLATWLDEADDSD